MFGRQRGFRDTRSLQIYVNAVVAATEIIYDTSSYYSDSKKFTVQRDSDNAISDFTPTEIIDGTYADWLGGANGILNEWKNEDGSLPLLKTGSPLLLTDGSIYCSTDNLKNTFDSELGDVFTLCYVTNFQNNANNQRSNCGIYGLNSGVNLRIVYAESTTYRRRQVFLGWKSLGGTEINRMTTTVTNYDNTKNNVFVLSIVDNVPKLLCNDVEYALTPTTDVNFVYYEDNINQVVIGNRANPTALINQFRHLSIRENPNKTTEELSAELMDVYLPRRTFIGGLAATYPTKEDLATKLGIASTDISRYKITGSDIECSINTNYSIPAYAFQHNQNLTKWLDYDGKCTNVDGSAFYNAEQLKSVKLNGVITGNGYAFAETDALKYLELKELTTITNATGGGSKGSRFIDDSRIEIFIAPKLSSVFRFGFYADGSSKKETKYLYLPAYTNPNGYGDTFFNMNPTCKCYFPLALQTSNGGGEDADVAYLRARGCTIVYIQNTTLPNNVTDLAYVSGTLTFTPPSSTNAIDKYMVFQNDEYLQMVSASGETVTGLVSGDKINIVPFDIYFNRSSSNTIII